MDTNGMENLPVAEQPKALIHLVNCIHANVISAYDTSQALAEKINMISKIDNNFTMDMSIDENVDIVNYLHVLSVKMQTIDAFNNHLLRSLNELV